MAVGYGYSYGKLSAMTVSIGGTITNVVTNAEYQPFGPAVKWTYGNGLDRGYTYDLDGRLTGISAGDTNTILQSLTYAYNTDNTIAKITNGVNSGITQSYIYDELSRLKQMSTGFGDTWTYQYDANGNRIRRLR